MPYSPIAARISATAPNSVASSAVDVSRLFGRPLLAHVELMRHDPGAGLELPLQLGDQILIDTRQQEQSQQILSLLTHLAKLFGPQPVGPSKPIGFLPQLAYTAAPATESGS